MQKDDRTEEEMETSHTRQTKAERQKYWQTESRMHTKETERYVAGQKRQTNTQTEARRTAYHEDSKKESWKESVKRKRIEEIYEGDEQSLFGKLNGIGMT